MTAPAAPAAPTDQPERPPATPATPTDQPESPPAVPPRDRMGVSGTQVAASVLASTSAAVVASFFGVAGTIIGAAVVSVVATVGTAAYGLGIRRTTERLQTLQVAARVGRPDTHDAAPGSPWARLAHRRWSLVGGMAVVLALSLGVVSLIEVVTDGPLSGSKGGRTSIGAVFDRRADSGTADDDGANGDGTDGDGGPTSGPTTTVAEGAPAPASEPATGGSTTTTTERAPAGGGATTTTSTTAPPSTTTTLPPAPSTTVAPVPDQPAAGSAGP